MTNLTRPEPSGQPLPRTNRLRASALSLSAQWTKDRHVLSVSGALIVGALVLSGCAADGPDPAPAAADLCPRGLAGRAGAPIAAATATSSEPLPALPPSVLDELGQQGTRDDACITVLGPDHSILELALTPHRAPGQVEYGARRPALLARNLHMLDTSLADLAARTDGLDTLVLLGAAVRAHPQPTTLFLVSSGISTVDPVDLRRLGWDTDGAVLGQQLLAAHYLPSMTGWQVRFIGLGEVAGAQPPLPDPLRARVIALWLGICRATGARCSAVPDYTTDRPPLSRDTVPVVPAPAPRIDGNRTWYPTSTWFDVDSSELGGGAEPALTRLVTQALRHDLSVSVTGHTDAATGTAEHNLALSRARAMAVRARLIQLGLPAERILSATGVGSAGVSATDEQRQPQLINQHRNVEIRFGTR